MTRGPWRSSVASKLRLSCASSLFCFYCLTTITLHPEVGSSRFSPVPESGLLGIAGAFHFSAYINGIHYSFPVSNLHKMDKDQQETLNSIQNSVYRTALKLRDVQTLCQLHLTDVSLIHCILPIRQCQAEKQAFLPLQQLLALLKKLFERVRLEKPGHVEPKAPELTLNLLISAYDRNGVGLIQPRSAATALIALSGDSLLAKYRAFFRVYATSPGRKSRRGLHITRNGVRNLLTDLLQILTVVGESCNPAYVETAIRGCFRGVLVAVIGEERFLSWLQTGPPILLWLHTCCRLSATELVAHHVKCNICKTSPITGLRYQCLKCLNFDICQVCFFTGQNSKPHKTSHPVMEHCVPVPAKENTKLFFRTIRNNLFQGRCKRKEARRRKDLMMTEEDIPFHSSARSPSSVPLVSSEQLEHPSALPSVPSLDPPSSRPVGEEVLQAQRKENHNKPQGQEDTFGQVLVPIKVELIKTRESVKALHRESRYLRKQLNKWRCKAQLLHSAQEDGNHRLQTKIHDLIANQEYLTVELQKVKQEVENVAKRNGTSLKERSFPNGVGCSPSKLSRSETLNDKSLEPISACPERSWLVGPQSGLFSGDSQSLETTPRTEPFQSTKPEADQHQIHGVKSVRLMPETSHPNQSQITSPCSPAAQGPAHSEKDIEQEEEEEEELQQLMLKLKDALSLQVQPGQTSALKKELLSAAEHVSKSFSGVLSQVSSPARKHQVSGIAPSLPNRPW